jgi:hypothetical protein
MFSEIMTWLIFLAISLVIIHIAYKWLENLLSRPKKTRDLVHSQTSKYKEMLDKLILETERPKERPKELPKPISDELTNDLLVFSRNLDEV